MNDFEGWMKKNKELCVATGIFGLLVSPFLWPFFIAVLFQSLSLAGPIILAWWIIQQPWKTKEEKGEETHNQKQRSENKDAAKQNPKAEDAYAPSENGKEQAAEPVRTKPKESEKKMPDEGDCLAVSWYQNEGRERFLQMKSRLDLEGIREFSISREGICSVRRGDQFQRIAVLRGYPGEKILAAKAELKQDGFSIRPGRKYVWVSWNKGGIRYAL